MTSVSEKDWENAKTYIKYLNLCFPITASLHLGCLLRFIDTNPEAETARNIAEMLGQVSCLLSIVPLKVYGEVAYNIEIIM